MPARIGAKTPVLILAHGANNDLDHPLLVAVARHLAAEAGTMVARFNFPYMERGSSSPDPGPVLENAFRRVHDHVADELAAPGAPIFIGGKSLGGRIAAELISRGEEGEGLVGRRSGGTRLSPPPAGPQGDARTPSRCARSGCRACSSSARKTPSATPTCFGRCWSSCCIPGGWSWCRAATTRCIAPGPRRPPAAAQFAEVAAEVARFIDEVAGSPDGQSHERPT